MPGSDSTKSCPFCGEEIKVQAIKCRHCGEYLDEEEDDRPGSESDAALGWLVPINRSGWAVAAGYLGLLSCFPCIGFPCGVLAVVTGILALRDCNRNPRQSGRGRAIFGIVLGIVAGLANLVGLIVMLIGWMNGWK